MAFALADLLLAGSNSYRAAAIALEVAHPVPDPVPTADTRVPHRAHV